MVKPKPSQILILVAFMAPFVFVMLGAWIWNLQVQLGLVQHENAQLHERLHEQVTCAPVHVTCDCPDYEEGWDDAEYVEGCNPEEFSVEDFQVMCDDLNQYGYVPGC